MTSRTQTTAGAAAGAGAARRCVRQTPLALVALALALPLLAGEALAAAPKTLLVEGYVHTGAGPAVDGDYSVTFKLYGGAQASTAFWQQVSAKVAVKAGQFAYALGSDNPLDVAAFGSAPEVWLGIQIGGDPELPRGQLHAVGFALRAAVADVAAGLSCTGCVKSSALQWDGDVDLAGYSLKASGVTAKSVTAQTVVAQEFLGDGSKLTGLAVKLPSGSCPSGQAVIAINADGSLSCKKLTQDVPSGSLEAVSNGALSNEFLHLLTAPQKDVPIPDNTGLEALSTITFDDVGAMKSISISVDVQNSDLATVSMVLLPPDDKKVGITLCDPCGKSGEKTFKATFPNPLAPQSGDLSAWIGKTPKGTWNLKIKDTGFCVVQLPGNKGICDPTAGTDGKILDWSITAATVSASDIAAKGQIYALGGVKLGASSAPCNDKMEGSLRYLPGAGLQLCDGKAWGGVGAGKARPRYVGRCGSNGGSSTYTLCLSEQIENTAEDYLTVTNTNTGSASDFNVGRVLVKKAGSYRFSFHRHGRGSSCQWWMYRSGNQVAYGYQTDGYTTVYMQDSATRTFLMNQNDYFNLRFNCNANAWYAEHTVLEVEFLGE